MVLDTCSDIILEIDRLRIGLGTPEIPGQDVKLNLAGSGNSELPNYHIETASRKTVTVSVTELPIPTPPVSPTVLQSTALSLERLPEIDQLELSTPVSPPPMEEKNLETFHCFPLLPPELRLKIWHLSFLPRTVELHTRRSHYADRDDLDHTGNSPKWRSSSTNAAALSVNAEARCAALEHYTVALRLSAPVDRRQMFEFRGQTVELPSALYKLSERVLHISPARDTVVLLGDLHYTRLKKLLDWFRQMDHCHPARSRKARGVGLRRVAMSTAPWAHAVGAATLRAFSRTLFADIDEFVLFLYAERVPPAEWSGGRCVLREATGAEEYFMGFAKQFMESESGGRRWMRVGRGDMRVADISFEEGWQ